MSFLVVHLVKVSVVSVKEMQVILETCSFMSIYELFEIFVQKYVVMENVTGILDMQMLDFPSVVRDESYLGQRLVKENSRRRVK